MFQTRLAAPSFGLRTSPVLRPHPGHLGAATFPPVVDGLASELHYVAQLTAVATSGVNALSTLHLAPSLAELTPYTTINTSVLTTLMAMTGDAVGGSEHLVRLREFLWHHTDAQRAYLDFVAECELLGFERAAIVHQRSLSQRWRKVCRHGSGALDELEELAAPGVPEGCEQNHSVLRALFNGASQGFRPCMDSYGALFIPPLPQQRRWPRRSVLQKCRVAVGSKKLQALMRDVSCGGVGLSGIARVLPGALVSIDMDAGRTLQGTVVWYQDQNAGVKLHKLLSPADPLISG